MINMLRTLGMLALLPTLLLPLTAVAELRIFACEPEWSALAEEIGGDLVEASSATHALQDPHYVQARPSLISKVRKADLVICSGAQLEIGWLPMLLSKANNSRSCPGKDGFLEASSLVRRLDVPDSVDRAQGDMHPQGNPAHPDEPAQHRRWWPRPWVSAWRSSIRRTRRTTGPARPRSCERWNAAMSQWEEQGQTTCRQPGRLSSQVLGLPRRLAGPAGGRHAGAGARHSADRGPSVRPAG